ncbi:CHAT domain-containing tetratricopeptide repeat protein [Mastigocoleus sp. MO_188.B34]|uniref:CHAT domain-containing protein n=1 Tax=Mastigocoleus sp. MO_188.B34 TaxID=3036635 RepID=UPI002623DB8B|nr:CHAT domain-containing tetratricopeptide repeat protein [Mastigocoleus sp. MO_188.B34]MDJ0697239.1 CHAT domain-containing protein [Mastigocoleus sp. MO_188.B34]
MKANKKYQNKLLHSRIVTNSTFVLFISLFLLSQSNIASAGNYELEIAQQSVTNNQDATRAKAQRLTVEGLKLFEQGTPESLKQAINKWERALELWQKLGEDKKTLIIITGSIGHAYRSLGDKQQALKYYNQVLLLQREIADEPGEALTLYSIASIYYSSGKMQQALNFYNQALLIMQKVNDKSAQATTLNSIGAVYDDLGDKQQALKFFNQALPLRREVKDKNGEALTLNRIGSVYDDLGDKQQALDYYNRALTINQEIKDKEGEAITLNNIGAVYFSLGDKQKALKFYNQALPLRREVDDKEGEAATLSNIGAVYFSFGNNQKALDLHNQGLSIVREIKDKSGEAATLNDIASIYYSSGKMQQALNFYNQALLIRREIEDKSGEAETLINVGTVYSSLGDKEQALNFYNQALPLLKEVQNKSGEAIILNNIGLVYSDLGDKQKALKFYDRALPLHREVENKSGQATTLNNIGIAHFLLGDKQKALKFSNQALLLSREVEDKSQEATTLNNIGKAHYDLGDKHQALKFYNQSLSLSREVENKGQEATTLRNLADLELKQGNLQSALNNSKAAVDIIEDLRTKVDREDLRTSYFATVQDIYKLHVDILMQLHKQNPSQGYDAQALNASEKSRARGLLELLTEARTDIRKGANPQLLAEENRLQQLISAKDKLRSGIVNDRNKSNDPISKAAAKRLEKEITNHLNEYKQLQIKIKKSNPKYAALKYPKSLNLPQIQQQLDKDTLLLQYSLGKERSYLWVVSPNSLKSYELPKKSEIDKSVINLFCLISQNSSKPPSATGKENSCANLKTRRIDLAAEELSKLVIAPVKDRLGKKRLVVVADGALQYIPFAALADPNSSVKEETYEEENTPGENRSIIVTPVNPISEKYSNYPPLLVNHEIINLPSASAIAIQRQEIANRKQAPKALAILADPVFSATDKRVTNQAQNKHLQNKQFQNKQLNQQNSLTLELERSALKRSADTLNRQGWGRLPGTRKESETLLGLVPETNRLQVFDFDANYTWATSSKLNQFRILHFATHGFVNDANPELSGIVLSLVNQQGKDIRGYLRLGDLFNLDYPADLIVLSACETGLGKEIRGEGLVGLTRGLMYAGAERLMVSLWKVSDEGTAVFMQEFYKEMLQNGKSANEALRVTQLKMWKQEKWRNPNYWAAFAFLGEWR